MTARASGDGPLGRFRGRDGKARLVEAIANQELVRQDATLAGRLAGVAKLNDCEPGQQIYAQGDPGKNCFYLVISGAMELRVNGRFVADIGAGQAVGEFPILDPALSHAVTLRVRERSIVAVVKEKDLRTIADEHGQLWKNMARMLVKRLHQANAKIPPEKAPCVFIGHGRSEHWKRVRSFVEGDLGLEVVSYETESRVGESIVLVLEKMLQQATFAVLVLTAEDETAQGNRRARQNVLHEAGFFQGALGFRRAILLVEAGVESFSNVAGLQYIEFKGEEIDAVFPELERVLRREGQVR